LLCKKLTATAYSKSLAKFEFFKARTHTVSARIRPLAPRANVPAP